MGSVTRDQSHQIMFALMTNTDWDAIDFETAQLQESIVRNPIEAGQQFTLFLKNGGRVIIGGPATVDEKKTKAIKLLLEFIGTVTIPAQTEPFIARDHFVINTANDAPVQIADLGNNFRTWFLDKTEAPRPKTTLCCRKLLKSSLDTPIIAELGGEEKAETTLSELFALLEQQAHGEKGSLLTNGYANIFYIRDSMLVLRAVRARWDDGGWLVRAYLVTGPDEWRGGHQVFSRNF